MPKNIKWYILSLFFLVVAVVNIPLDFIDMGGDSCQYIILAESISHGMGLKAVNMPASPYFFYYPPLFPLLLSPIIYFFGRNFYLMQLLVVFCGYLSLFFLYRVFKKTGSSKIAFLAVTVFGTNYLFIVYCSKFILSEAPYILFSGAAIFFIQEYFENGNARHRLFGACAAASMLMAYFTRYTGIALFAAAVLSLFFLKGNKLIARRILLVCTAFLIPVLLWQAAAKMLSSGIIPSQVRESFIIDPYRPFLGVVTDKPEYLLRRFTDGFFYYYKIAGDAFFAGLSGNVFLRDFLRMFCFGFTVAGFLFSFRESKIKFLHCYFLFYLLLLVFWPFREGDRFIVAVLPFIYFYFLTAVDKLIFNARAKAFFSPAFYPALFLFAVNLIFMPFYSDTSRALPGVFRNFIMTNTWIKKNTPPEAVIISRKPTLTYFYSGRRALVYPFVKDYSQAWRDIIKYKASYIIVDEFSSQTQDYLVPFIINYKDKFRPKSRAGNTVVLEITGIPGYGQAGDKK